LGPIPNPQSPIPIYKRFITKFIAYQKYFYSHLLYLTKLFLKK
jgi:hypothetical protein